MARLLLVLSAEAQTNDGSSSAVCGIHGDTVGSQRASYAEDTGFTRPTGVTLYEVSERVSFNPDPSNVGVIRRNATSPLQGFAALGTPLCPSALVVSIPRIESCTVIATGTDRLDAHGGWQRSDRSKAAFYLADDLHTTIPVRSFERSTGFPVVRLELSFRP